MAKLLRIKICQCMLSLSWPILAREQTADIFESGRDQ
jgi:hypothetical protein